MMYLSPLFFLGQATAQDCTTPYLPSSFKTRLAWRSTNQVTSAFASPVVANMNPQSDSMPEIIIAEGTNSPIFDASNKIQFFRGDGSNFNNPMTLTIPGNFAKYPVPGPTIGDVNNDGRPELIMVCYDRRIRVFHNYTENPVAPMTLWMTSTGLVDFVDQRALLADFDGDGVTEIYAGSNVFKFNFSNPAAPALTKVITGLVNRGRSFRSNYGEGACNPVAVELLTVADCNGDPDCGGLELAAGPVIYSIDLDPTDGDGIQLKIQRNVNNFTPDNLTDGYTGVADIDLDGILDVVVTSWRRANQSGMYAWNKNGLLGFFPNPVNFVTSGSIPCIANVFDDTKAGFAQDFPEILICSSLNFTCFNLHALTLNPAAPYWWNLPTSDGSGWTGSTVYDFNGDGFSEIVYRDETDLRILYGGGLPFPPGVDAERNWYKLPCYSGTADEYPIVADVDNDGETEIAVSGNTSGGNSISPGYLHVFESDDSPWLPSRNVWNQFNYFVVNINDDLSVPAQQMAHHLELPAAGSGRRPLNNYLAQRPLLNENFESGFPLPDASADIRQVTCNTDSLRLELNICNTGDKILQAGIPVAFYNSDPTSTNAALLMPIQFIPVALEKDSCRVFSFTVPRITGTIYGVVNDDGSIPRPYQLAVDFPVTDELECRWLNNIFQIQSAVNTLLDLGTDVEVCKDTILNLTASPGFASYLWQDGSTNAVFQAQAPGVYWVEATDFCAQKRVDTLQILALDHPDIQLDTINGDCFGQIGMVTVSSSGLYPPFTYNWSSSDTSPGISGLPDGTYTVTVTNARGCTSTGSTWLEAGGNLQATASIASPINCFGQTGALQLDIAVGKAPFNFSWSDGSSAQNLGNAPAGNYLVTITDADACSQTLQISLTEPPPLLSAGLSTTPACPGLANGSATFLGASQGTPPYTTQWSTAETTPVITGLTTAAYALTLSDALGCTLVETVQVPEFTPPATQAAQANVSCFGKNDGWLTITPLGGSPGFDFLWSNGETTPDIYNLQPGSYSLTLSYANGMCTQTFDYQVTEPLPIVLSSSANPAICNNGLGGSIDLSVQNGVAPLLYSWSNGALMEDLSNITSGNYEVTVTDADGCTETESVDVAELPVFNLSATTQTPLCAGSTEGAIQLALSGGSPPFQAAWSNGSNGLTLNGLAAGTYTATITDAAACTALYSVSIDEPNPLTVNGAVAVPACPGMTNGEATFLGASQGTPPYALTWSNGATAAHLTGLATGVYQYTITDANACSVTDGIQVPEYEMPVLAASVADLTCFNAQNGSISVAVQSGTPAFGFSWSNGATGASIQGLEQGNYTLTLSYADGVCSQTFDYQVNEPSEIALVDATLSHPLCFDSTNGTIVLSVEGGIQPYQYIWSNGQQTKDISNLAAGFYTLTLTDGNGCTFLLPFQITQPQQLATSFLLAADTCQSNSGAILSTASGGVAPYQFAWSNGATSPNLNNLGAGQYSLTLTDAHACTLSLPVNIPIYGELPQANAFGGTVTCVSPAIIGVTANQSDLHYTWQAPSGMLSDQATHSVFEGGLYEVTVSNIFGCLASTQVQVLEDKESPAVEAGPALIQVPCSETLLLLDATGSDMGAPYSNQWQGWANGIPTIDTQAIVVPVFSQGLYVHIVLNTLNGCSATDTVQVNWDEPISAIVAVDSIQCFGANNGRINIDGVSGGTGTYLFSIDNHPFTGQSTFTGQSPGVHILRVRDDMGCSWERTVLLTEPAQLQVALLASDTLIEMGQQVILTALVLPESTHLSDIEWTPPPFLFDPMALQQALQPETSTEFAVRVVDNNGCAADDRVLVSVYNHQIYAPNAILPGSAANGSFTLFGGNEVLELRLMRVFDRWGDLVFERKNFPLSEPSQGWDGTFNGQLASPGVYVWLAEVLLDNGQVLFLKGDVTVLR
jgi:hypothetical protein